MYNVTRHPEFIQPATLRSRGDSRVDDLHLKIRRSRRPQCRNPCVRVAAAAASGNVEPTRQRMEAGSVQLLKQDGHRDRAAFAT